MADFTLLLSHLPLNSVSGSDVHTCTHTAHKGWEDKRKHENTNKAACIYMNTVFCSSVVRITESGVDSRNQGCSGVYMTTLHMEGPTGRLNVLGGGEMEGRREGREGGKEGSSKEEREGS